MISKRMFASSLKDVKLTSALAITTMSMLTLSLASGCDLLVDIGLLPQDSLVAYWSFDESGNVALDWSHHGNDGEIKGAWRTQGIIGQALAFDGRDDWVYVSNSPSLQTTLKGLTIDVWVAVESFPRGGRPFATGIIAYGTRYQGIWELRVLDSGRVYFLLNWNTFQETEVITDEVLNINVWHHITATFDGATARVYLDGALLGETEAPPLNYPAEEPWLAIGDDFPGVSEFFHGRIDELRVFNQAFAPSELQRIIGNQRKTASFIWPVLGISVSDPLQNTRDPRQDGWYVANGFGNTCPDCSGDPTHPYHPGEDWNRLGGRDQDANLPVYAIADGEVIRSTKLSDELGWAIIIRHRLPQEIDITPYVLPGTLPPRPRTYVISSAYFHLNQPRFGELDIRKGDSPVPIRKGEVVGTIFPNTPGGPHLHFEIRANDDARTADPATSVNGYYASPQAITDFGYIDPSAFLRAQIASIQQ